MPEATPLPGRLLANCLFPETLLMGLRAWETDRGAPEERAFEGHETCEGSANISISLRATSVKHGNHNKGRSILF